MSTFYNVRRLALAAVALVAFLLSAASVDAQTFKKGIFIEEWTGDWCGHCPRGAWTMDSLEHLMGNKAVIISWHNGSQSEPMRNPTSDTMTSWFGISGYPGAIVHRWYNSGIGAYAPNEPVTNLVATGPNALSKVAPLVDFRIVNATYNPATRELDFDLDMTPYPKNLSKLPSFDTAKYVTAAIVTEDGLVYDQVNYGYGGLDNPIEGFIHMNVGRRAIGKALGDDLAYTATTTVLPARRHYSMIVNAEYDHSKVEIKVFVAARHPKSKQYGWTTILDAAQTPYLTTLPVSASDMVYVITPNEGGPQPAGNVKLFWGKGGNVNNVKIEYSDNGQASWNSIIASTNVSPYDWAPPSTAVGKQIVVRVSSATNASVNSISGQFSVQAAPVGSITITKPASGESLIGGAKGYAITWTKTGTVTASKTIEFSPDFGTTWEPVGTANNDNLSFSWDVANVQTSQGLIRITDANNTSDLSDPFSIARSYITIVKPVANETIEANKEYSINFSKSPQGVTTNKTLEYSLDNGATWTEIVKLTTDVNTYKWMVPDVASTEALVRITDDNGIRGITGVFTIAKVAKPSFKTFTFSGPGVTSTNIPFNTLVTFQWTFTNDQQKVPGPYIIQMSTDDGSNWDDLVQSAQGTYNVDWTSPSEDYIPEAYFRITNMTSENGQTLGTSTGISIGTQGAVKNNGGMPVAFRLGANYPNPFNSMTNINFDVPERSFVNIIVRNELGQEIARIASGMLDAGSYTADFDASKLPTGLYTYTLESGATKLTGKMSVVR